MQMSLKEDDDKKKLSQGELTFYIKTQGNYINNFQLSFKLI